LGRFVLWVGLLFLSTVPVPCKIPKPWILERSAISTTMDWRPSKTFWPTPVLYQVARLEGLYFVERPADISLALSHYETK